MLETINHFNRQLILICLLFFLFCGCSGKKQKEFREKVVRITVSKPQKRLFQRRLAVQGTVIPLEFAVISSRTEGVMDVLLVKEGQRVKKGDKLFQVDRRNLENQVTVNRKNLEVCRAELKNAEIVREFSKLFFAKAQGDFRRAQILMKSRAVSTESFESTELSLREAETGVSKAEAGVQLATAQVGQQQSSLQIAEKNLADSEILAPFDGVITEKLVEPGEFVKLGTNILKMQNPDCLEVECLLSAANYQLIVPGKTKVLLSVDGSACGTAVVSYRSPNIEPLSRTFKIKVALPGGTSLVSGMLCGVDLILEESGGIGVPVEAVLVRGDEHVVFAKNGDRAEMIPVICGIIDGKYIQIIAPGNLGEKEIIVTGQSFVNKGDRVALIDMGK